MARTALKLYLLKKLREMEAAREAAHKAPTTVLLKDYHDSIMEDMREEIANLNDDGIIEMGPTLNGLYLHLNPENAIE